MKRSPVIPWLAPILLVLAGLAAFADSLGGPFIFDDGPSVADNPSLRSGWRALQPPAGGLTVSGRPALNLSLAVNRALSGERVGGYHAVNLAIHLLAALLLFGVVRRTAARGEFGAISRHPREFAFMVAVLWEVHPLQTESVTYIVQRAESLMGMFYLLTVYAFIRCSESDRSETLTRSATGIGFRLRSRGTRKRFGAIWAVVSITACLLGMATKEVMVSAPLIVLLYDRTFVAGSFVAAWRRRRPYYSALAATWALLAFLVLRGGGSRGASAGLGQGISPSHYLLTQCWAIAHYLRLALWPHPLVLDYGAGIVRTLSAVWPQAILIVGLLSGTVIGLFGRVPWIEVAERVSVSERAGPRTPDENLTVSATRSLGFLGAWFFLILAPSSSVVPIVEQTAAEHRMYLPLAAVIVAGVAGLAAWCGRRAFPIALAIALLFGGVSFRRNRDYASPLALWSGAARARPENARAHLNFGLALIAAGRLPEAVAEESTAVRLRPDFAEAQSDLGNALQKAGRRAEALDHLQRAVELDPAKAEARNNWGAALAEAGRRPEAVAQYREAIRLRPDYADAENNLGMALCSVGEGSEGVAHLARAVELKPEFAEAHANLGTALAMAGRLPEAIAEFIAALRLDPRLITAHENAARALQALGRPAEANEHLQEAARLRAESL